MTADMGKQYGRVVGPGYKFTRFGAMSNELVKRSSIGFPLTSAHEGLLSGVCSSGAFETGHYTLNLHVGEKATLENGDEGFWINSTVSDKSRNVQYDVGSIHFPGHKAVLSRQVASFVELVQSWDENKIIWYSNKERPFFDLVQECTVYLGNAKLDGKELIPDEISVILPHSH